MTASLITTAPRRWKLEEDDEGFRTYTLWLQVKTDTSLDGPAVVRQCPGLPLPGSFWEIDNDIDVYAICQRRCSVTPRVDDRKNTIWDCVFTYTNKPGRRCCDTQRDDPLTEPPKISITFQKHQEEATVDRFGLPIVNSAKEQFRGAQVEFDRNRLQVTIEYNVLSAELPLVTAMIDHVNDAPLWGLPARCIKLSEAPTEKKYKGQCEVYWTRKLVFDCRADTHDRILLDEGTKAIRGHWDMVKTSKTFGNYIQAAGVDGTRASDFILFKDPHGENCKVILDGKGFPSERQRSTSALCVDSATLEDAGDGYTVGDVLTIVGGTGTAATVYVGEVSALGGIEDILVFSAGPYTDTPASPVTATGGSGTGAAFNLTFVRVPAQVSGAYVDIANSGTDYAVGDILQVSGGTFTRPALLRVLTVAPGVPGFGPIRLVTVYDPGEYTVIPSNNVSTTAVQSAGTGGSGAQFSLNWIEVVDPDRTGHVLVQKYEEANLLLLGIPIDLEAP